MSITGICDKSDIFTETVRNVTFLIDISGFPHKNDRMTKKKNNYELQFFS